MRRRKAAVTIAIGLIVGTALAQNDELDTRREIAAANMQDAVVVDCLLPGKLRKLGGIRTYLTPGTLIRTAAINCRSRGGEYTLGNLASGTLSLQRWMEPAQDGNAEAQYLVARIYANGMDNVPVDYKKAAFWYEKASRQGYSEAQQELGYLYEQGLGVEQDLLKALNLQRDASGLGEDLDYAYKIADAERLAEELTVRLAVTNDVLRDSQRRSQQAEDNLANATAEIHRQEVRTTALLAELRTLQAAQGAGDPRRVQELEQELEGAKQALSASQAAAVELETERDAINAQLALQKLGGQAAQLELRELLARTESAEQKSESLATQLAESQQRLIQSDEELRELRIAYQQQSDQLAADANRLLEAREQSDSDAAAYIAAKEAELASKAARVASLEVEVQSLKTQLQETDDQETVRLLRSQLASLQTRFDEEVTRLQTERERLTADYSKNEEDLNALYAQSQQELTTMTRELDARKRQIDTLSAESERLRARVGRLEDEQIASAQNSEAESVRLKAQMLKAQQEAVNLRNTVAELRSEKSATEATLAKSLLDLRQLTAGKAESDREVLLLNADIASYRSTLSAQNLRIESLEQQISEMDEQIADLNSGLDEQPAAGDQDTGQVEIEDAIAVLDLAHSGQIPNLSNFHALLIANEEYQNLPPLETPVSDAREIERLLTTNYGFDVEMLVNATDDDIMRKLHEYSNELTPEDNLIIYYAGRGSTPEGPPDRAYWLGVDADPEVGTGLLLAEHISEKIKQMRAQRVLVITDSCFSKRRLQKNSLAVGRGLDPNRFRLLANFQSRNVLTSGANVPILDEDGDRSHSLFAKDFIEILRQNENVLSGEMLAFEMAQRMGQQLDDPARSTPTYNTLQGAGHKAGDFFFVPTPMNTLVADL